MVNKDGLPAWALSLSFIETGWDEALPQMIQQGIKYAAFREQCILDLQDLKKFAEMVFWYQRRSYDKDARIRFTATPAGKMIRVEITNMIKKCMDWNQFRSAMRTEGSFFTHIRNEVEAGMRHAESHWTGGNR